MKYLFVVYILLIVFFVEIWSEQNESNPFYFDAICYKSKSNDSLSRIDIFILVPYSSITFLKKENYYNADYDITIILKDSLGNRINSKTFSKSVYEYDQLEILGLSGKFQDSFYSFEVKEGKIIVEVQIYDRNSNATFSKSRTTNTLNFSKYNFALSGIMFLSEIQKENEKFKITPHLSDNLSDLPRVFVFLEVFQPKFIYSSCDFVYQIQNFKGKEIFRSPRYSKNFNKSIEQLTFPLQLPQNLAEGTYFLRVSALKQNRTDSIFTDFDILAVTERTFKISPSLSSFVIQNLDKSIRQLKYVAYQKDIDYINETKEPEEKLRRFNEFWKRLDPTPSTELNEAFEEYYSRIKYSNEHFKSYIEGWLTDRGMVYIVLGPPLTVQQQTDNYYNRTYEIWTYANNRQFIFVDYSGFGDFRLYSPPTFSEKFVYRP
ncbi:MAG: GWxTD domain-containing protein [Candidatus Kapaibacteriales bacterium]